MHPDAEQAADGTLRISAQGGYVVAERHKDLYRDAIFPNKPNMLPPAEVVKSKPAWAECFALKSGAASQAILAALHSGEQEEIRLRARMMAAVDEGVGAILDALERKGELDNTFIVFLGDNGFFFGEHALGPERRFAYEEGIRSPFVVRYPRKVKAGSRRRELVICQDIAPTLIELAGGKPGPQIQGRSLLPLFAARARGVAQVDPGRVLGRAGDAVARRHDVQGGAHRPLQVHPLGQPRQGGRARRALRPRARSVRAQQSEPQPHGPAGARQAAARIETLVAEAVGL